MNGIWAIAKREFRSYFDSPIAYVAISVFLVMAGVLFFFAGEKSFFTLNEATLRSFFEWAPLIFVFYLPAISMRAFSEEQRSGTIELLVTMPVSDMAIVLGKFLASLGFLLVTLAFTLVYPAIVASVGKPDWGPIVGGYVGLLLVGAAYLAIGVMTSTWTKNQIVSFVVSLLICGFFFFVDRMVGEVWEGTREVFAYLSFNEHFQSVARGVLDTRDIVFYLSVAFVGLLVASFSLHNRRVRG